MREEDRDVVLRAELDFLDSERLRARDVAA